MSIRRITRFAAIATLAAASFSGVPLLAHAGPSEDVASQTVRFDDLNLASEAGIAALYRRIQSAARSVCGPVNVTGSRIASQEWKDCVSNSVRQAIFTVNRPRLTAYYADHLRVPLLRSAG